MDNTINNICPLLGGGKNIIFDRVFLDYVKATTPGIIHPCPYVTIKFI